MAVRGEYNTKQKEKLLKYLEQHPTRSFTVEEIVEDMKQQGDSVGKTTVYRHMEALNKLGSVRRSVPEAGGSAVYQYVPDAEACDQHFHMRCTACGELFHVECKLFERLSEHLRQDHGFVIDARHSVLSGVCRRCRMQNTF